MNIFKRKKQSSKQRLSTEEVIWPQPDESGQVTLIINEMIYDNFLIHEKIEDWIGGEMRVITSNFKDLEKDISHIEYRLISDITETFVEDHKHVILHCTVPEYLLKEMLERV